MKNEIKSDSKNAIAELKAKVEKLREEQESMKKANAYYRKYCTMQGYEDWSDDEAAKANAVIQSSYEKKPFAAYKLQNNNQNIRATELRIKQLEQEHSDDTRDYDTEELGFEVYEDKDNMRLRLYFADKPEEEIRNELKSRGFKWSPTNECWQRLLNSNARFSLSCFIRFMEKREQEAVVC